MRKLFTTIFFTLIYLCSHAQITGKVAGWNYNVHLPANYNLDSTKKFPVLIFIPGLGEIGADPLKLVQYGPHAFLRAGGDPLPGWIIISLQPAAAYPNEVNLKIRIDSLIKLFRIDTTRINLTGLSHGGWCAATYVSGIINYINTVITVQGVRPDDNSPYPYGFSKFNGTGYLCFEQRLDGRDGRTVVNYLNSIRPGVATFIETNFGGGGHCCWNEFYGGGGTQPASFAALNNLNLYQWLILKNTFTVVSLPPVIRQPAPALPTFYFTKEFIHLKSTRLTSFSIYNAIGAQVAAGKIMPGNNKIPIQKFPSGVYYFKTQFYKIYKFYKY